MAWVAEEKFTGYTDEANLAGLTGGSGWSAGWVNGATNLIRADNAQSFEGGLSARTITSGGGNTFYTRLLTSAESGSGTMYVAMMKSVNNAGENAFSLRSSAGNRVGITMNSSGNIVASGTTLLSGYSANVWYVIEINYNVASNNFTARVHNGTSWGSMSGTISMGSSGNIDRVGLGGDTHTGTCHIDTITATDPTVNPNVTVSPATQACTFSLPSVAITTEVSVGGSVPSAVFSLPSPTVTATRNVTVSRAVLSAVFSIPSYSVTTPDANITLASPLSATFSLPASTVSAQRQATVSPSVLSATFSLPSSSPSTGVSNPATTLTLTFSLPTPAVTAIRSVTVSPSVFAMTFSLPSATEIISVSVSPALLAMTFSLPSSIAGGTRSVTVSASILTMLMSIPSPFVRGDFWSEKFPVASDPFTDKVYNENDNWVNKF